MAQDFIFQTSASGSGSIFGKKQNSLICFMAIANSKLNDNENKHTMQDPGVTLLKLDASEQACSHNRWEAR